MALTISNWGNFSTNMATPNQGIASEDWAALGKGFGGLAKWAQTQKAAELMEGTKGVQGRINAIDAEIAQLEAQLQSLEEQNQAEQAKAQAARDEANRQAMDENLWNSYLRENAKPTEYTQPKGGMIGNDYVAAMNKADAMRQGGDMGGYETSPTDPNVLQAAMAAGQMLNYRPTFGGRASQPDVKAVSPDYVAEEQQARENAMAALNAQRRYRWGR